ncbi:MAG: DNA polymerase III subunit beta [Ignavibacteria bacterium]|nr:DNA polymerase III subunit beta [Ignavibacteria bacterium]
MIFSTNSKVLEKVLSKVFPAVPARTPMPILENYLFQIEEGKLTITATDIEITLRSSIFIDSTENAEMVVPAKLLFDIVKSLGDTLINFEVDPVNSKMKLKTETGYYNIGYASAEEFPKIPDVNHDKKFGIAARQLKKSLDQTSFAVSKEAIRPAMMGLLIEFNMEGLRFVATDGHRLVRYSLLSEKSEIPEQYVVPERATSVLSKLLVEGNVEVALNDSTISFLLEDVELTSRLINQKYPDYSSVIPLENEFRLKVKKSELQSSIKRMLLFTTTNYQQVKLTLTTDQLEITAENIEHGSSAKEMVSCEYMGDAMSIGFNAGFLNDVLSHLDDTEAVFKLHSPTKACIIEPLTQKENEDLMMLLMPVRINN